MSKQQLIEYAKSKNIVDLLEKDQLQKILDKVTAGIEEDKQSMAPWLKRTDEIVKLTSLVEEKTKNTPFENASNIKYPLIAKACLEWASRTYPEIIQDGRVVKTLVSGPTNPLYDAIANGVAIHMSHQLLGADTDWETSLDKLLNSLPVIGFLCKKTYYDPIKQKICSQVCYYKDLIIRNDPSIQSFDSLRRITHIIHCYPSDIISNSRRGLYNKDACMEIMNNYSDTRVNAECDLYECHCFLDLDDDDYEEPYVVVIHKQTRKIVQMYARYTSTDIEDKDDEIISINPIQYFTDYGLLQPADGSFMCVGFGSLMLHINEMINTLGNELIDAGKLANLQTGIISSDIKIMGGELIVEPGQWTRVKSVSTTALKDSFMPIQYKEPSNVLFQLLSLLLEAGKDLTSATDALEGALNATNVPATSMLAMIEQGLKLNSSIQRRLYKSLKSEFEKIYRLNGMHLDEEEYLTILGPQYESLPNIYKTKAIKVIPIADPNLSSDAQRNTQAQAVMQLASMPNSPIPMYEAVKLALQAIRVNNLDKLLPPQMAQQPKAPDPKMVDVQLKHQSKQAELQLKGKAQELKEKQFVANLSKTDSQITETNTKSLKNVAQAQNLQHNQKMSEVGSRLDALKTQISAMETAHQQMNQSNLEHARLQQTQQQIDNQHKQAMTGTAVDHAKNMVEGAQGQQELNQNAQDQQFQQQAQQGAQQETQQPEEPTGGAGGSNE